MIRARAAAAAAAPSGAVAGFDLTFRAPKSVSVLFGVAEQRGRAASRPRARAGGRPGARATSSARRAGRVAAAAGAVRLPGRGFVAAAFGHRSSRAGDPLLHTHVVVANATQAADGRWTALDGRELYRHAKTAGYLYQAALRAELSRELGLRWQPGRARGGRCGGRAAAVVEHFSQRRAEILEQMAARGETLGARGADRDARDAAAQGHGVPARRLREEWRARAAEHGLDASR